jgi:hypothetical protein
VEEVCLAVENFEHELQKERMEQWVQRWLKIATIEYDEQDQIFTLGIRDRLIMQGEGETAAAARADLAENLRCVASSGKLKSLPEPSVSHST